jgi:hypothetical protein
VEHQIFVERILENESLTGDLEDGPAARLLQWGTGHVRALVEALDDEAVAGTRVNALMALMRQVNRTAGNSAEAATPDLVADLARLLERHAAAFGNTRPASVAEVETAAIALTSLPPDQAVSYLLEWLDARNI